jgi:hypothetical protein
VELNQYEVIDNFLEKEHFNLLKNFLLNEGTPWYFRKNDTKNSKNKNGYFNFTWYNNCKPCFPTLKEHLAPIFNKLDVFVPIQVRANMTFRDSDTIESAWHIDYDISASTTAILYFTTCNAKTLLQIDNKEIKIDNFENRLLRFNTTINHKIIYQTDVYRRIIMNLNYIPNENE